MNSESRALRVNRSVGHTIRNSANSILYYIRKRFRLFRRKISSEIADFIVHLLFNETRKSRDFPEKRPTRLDRVQNCAWSPRAR